MKDKSKELTKLLHDLMQRNENRIKELPKRIYYPSSLFSGVPGGF